ncbi:MAG TPA: biopolymer transporter ExbD [Rhodopila sp.]|jgi:biopolymer transport protein ExbD
MAIDFSKGQAAGDPDVLVDINTTPLIDVMLVLLIMLIITIPIQTHAVKLDLPVGTPPPPVALQPQVIDISVDFDGSLEWNGEPVTDRSALEQRLATAVRQPVQPELHLRADRLASYKYVAEVLASAQRLGLTKIGLVGNEQFLAGGDD